MTIFLYSQRMDEFHMLTIHWGLARRNFKSHESQGHISGQKRTNRWISYALLTRGQCKEKNGILNGHTAQGGRPKRPLPLCVAPGNQSIQNLSIRTFLPCLEPGPSRAGYFPRDMLPLTTARERAWRLLKIIRQILA